MLQALLILLRFYPHPARLAGGYNPLPHCNVFCNVAFMRINLYPDKLQVFTMDFIIKY